ncbi:hypothetical protein ACTWPB_19150 [Nocardia sp. IBHARD005]|uniref:hypothetical protein n=1 Tax=Nocardia sp. IBHARD005 TaxID=3457765 RepID=UPI004058B652
MPTIIAGAKRFYGAHPLYLLVLLAGFSLFGYIIAVMGPATLWNPDVWWQSILVWFLGAVIAHDFVLFPLYALADRLLTASWHAARGRRPTLGRPIVSPVNYLRIPALGSGLLLLLFFPGIFEQGKATYLAATGQTQQPFLVRWLLVSAVMFGVSALSYVVARRYALRQRRLTEVITT